MAGRRQVVPHGCEGRGDHAPVPGLVLESERQEGVAEGTAHPGQVATRPDRRGDHRRQPGRHPRNRAPGTAGAVRLDQHRDDEEEPDRAHGSGHQSCHRRPPPPAAPDGQKRHGGAEQQGSLGIGHHQGERRRGEGQQPYAPAGQAPIAELALDQDPQHRHAGQRAEVGDDDQSGPGADPRDPPDHPSGHREARKETKGLLSGGGIAVAGDRLVPAAVPAEQALMDPQHAPRGFPGADGPP